MSQTSSSSAWSGDLGGNYCQACWCTANLDKSGFVCCTRYSNWEEFVSLSPGTGLCFLSGIVYAEFHEFDKYRVFRLILDCVNLVNQVVGVLWIISYIGSLFNFLTLIYICKFYSSVALSQFHALIFYFKFSVSLLLIFLYCSCQVFFLACLFPFCMTSTRIKSMRRCMWYMGLFTHSIKRFIALFWA